MQSNKLYNFAETVAKGNPSGVMAIARDHNYHVPNSTETGIGFIIKFVQDKKEDAIKKLVHIHPDRDLILASEERVRYSNFLDGTVNYVGEKVKDPEVKMSMVVLVLIFAVLIIAIINNRM